MIDSSASAHGLCEFVDASPSPFHVVATILETLVAQGFTELDEASEWSDAGGAHYVVRGGSIIAWDARGARNSFRIVGGHTDSPNLRVKQNPEFTSAGMSMVSLEPYGGAWLNSWLDRDLGVSGRMTVRSGTGYREQLIAINEPIMRVPQLAIHLSADRTGVALDPQQHVHGIFAASDASFVDYLCDHASVNRADVLGWELMAHDVAPSAVIGAKGDLVSAPRLDNQGTCYAGLRALLDARNHADQAVAMLALFDHEEVGSGSERGAASDFLSTVCERIVLAGGGDRARFLSTMAASVCASGDMAHATHPNYAERHEPQHRIAINGGPVLKVNQNLRYATDAGGAAVFAIACADAGVPIQRYVHRADLPCGSTIGPITATRTGLTTVDVGAAQLAMHSARECMGADDVAAYSAALQAFLSPR